MRLMRWVHRMLRPPVDEVPPELEELLLPNLDERRQFLAQEHANLRHRERILRALEIRANVRGGAFENQESPNGN